MTIDQTFIRSGSLRIANPHPPVLHPADIQTPEMTAQSARTAARRAHPGRTGCGGFTLVELLVVIGIIALLISILLPSLSKARETSNNVKCLSNLRQLAVAIIGYAGDNHGQLPPSLFIPNPTGATAYVPVYNGEYGNPIVPTWNNAWPGWDCLIFPWLSQSKGAFVCPSDPYQQNTATLSSLDDVTYTGRRSYACNGYNATNPLFSTNPQACVMAWNWSQKLSACASDTFLVVDRWHPGNTLGADSYGECGSINHLSGTQKPAHNGKPNFAFVDGHVEAFLATDPTIFPRIWSAIKD